MQHKLPPSALWHCTSYQWTPRSWRNILPPSSGTNVNNESGSTIFHCNVGIHQYDLKGHDPEDNGIKTSGLTYNKLKTHCSWMYEILEGKPGNNSPALVMVSFGIFTPCSDLCLIHTEKIQQDATVYQNFISYLYEAQPVSGDTPPITRSLKLH